MFRKHFEDYLPSYRHNSNNNDKSRRNFSERCAMCVCARPGTMTYAFVPMYVLVRQNHLSTTTSTTTTTPKPTLMCLQAYSIHSSKRCRHIRFIGRIFLRFSTALVLPFPFPFSNRMLETWLLPIEPEKGLLATMWHIENAFKMSTRLRNLWLQWLLFSVVINDVNNAH